MLKENPFQDELIDEIRNNRGVYCTASGNLICFPEEFGFCRGVKLAISRLLQKKNEKKNSEILLLGAMIHNPVVNRWFEDHGVRITDEVEAGLNETEPTVFVIPAFGLPLDQEHLLHDKVGENSEIWDCTCPFVRNVWSIARREALAGRAVFVHGNPHHPETRAIWSRICTVAGAAALVADIRQVKMLLEGLGSQGTLEQFPPEQLHHPELLTQLPWTLVNQTTMLYHETERIAELLREGCPAGDFIGNGTICDATRKRQLAAEKLVASDCSMIIVLGGIDSSNTIQLYKLAKMRKKAYFIQNPADVSQEEIRHYDPLEKRWFQEREWMPENCRKIGILAGASCPDTQLGILLRRLSEFF